MRIIVAVAVAGLAPVAADAENAGIPCTCRYAGAKFSVGTVTCIHTPTGDRLARCDMVLNNTSWTFLRDGCPISRRLAPVIPHGPVTSTPDDTQDNGTRDAG